MIDLEGDAEFQRLVITTRHGLALVQALRLDVEDEPTDVVQLVTTEIPVQSGDASAGPTGRPSRRRAPRPAQA